MPIPAEVQGQAVWDFGQPGLTHQSVNEIHNFHFNITAQNHCKISALNFPKIGLFFYYMYFWQLG